MKKVIAVIMLLAMAVSFCACGAGSETPAQNVGSEKAPAAAEQTAEPSEAEAPDELAAAEQAFRGGNYEEAFRLLSAHKDDGLPSVCEMLAQCCYYGMGTGEDAEVALRFADKAAAGGSIIAKYIQADAAANVSGARLTLDETEALYKDFVSAAQALDSADPAYGTVMAYLADCYANGKGVEKDSGKALDAAAKSEAAGNLTPFDMAALAQVYDTCAASDASEPLDGLIAAPVHSSEADALYAKAADALKAMAEAGSARAQKLLGDLYFGGRGGLGRDYEKALALYEQAADQDYADAQAQLGYMYMLGEGVEMNYEKAMEWNNRAAQQGNAQGQSQIGYMYHKGLGVTQNLDEAGRWYSRAAQQGNSWAADRLIETEVTNPQSVFEAHA